MRNILYIIILAVALCACNNSTQIDGILDTAELMAVKHPDSAQTILETLYPFVVFLEGNEEHSGHLPECGRCFARMGFEETNEMLRIVKTHTFANHCDGQRVIIEQLFGMGEKAVGNDVLGSTTSFHAHQVSEISARQTAFVCKIGHCGQSLSQGFRGDVVIQQFHESLHHRMVDFLASDELAVIEAETIVQ